MSLKMEADSFPIDNLHILVFIELILSNIFLIHLNNLL